MPFFIKLILLLPFFVASTLLAADDVAPPTQPLTFEQAVSEIVKRDPLVQKARAEWDQARARNVPNHLVMAPSLELTATQMLARRTVFSRAYMDRNITAVSKFNLFHFGSDLATMKAATSEEEIFEKGLEGMILESEERAITAVSVAIAANMQLAAGERIMQDFGDQQRMIEQRARSGLITSMEANKVMVDLGHIQSVFLDTRRKYQEAYAVLRVVLGHDRLATQWPWKDKLAKASFSNTELTNRLLRQRPDWIAAKKNVEFANYSMKASYGLIFPSLDLNLSGGWGAATSLGLSEPIYSVGITLTIPLFDKLSQISQYRAAVARGSAAEAEQTAAQRIATIQWTAIKNDLAIFQEDAKLCERNVNLARTVSSDSIGQINSGLADANSLILGQRRIYNAELDSIDAWRNAHRAYGTACHSLGLLVKDCSAVAEDKTPTSRHE